MLAAVSKPIYHIDSSCVHTQHIRALARARGHARPVLLRRAGQVLSRPHCRSSVLCVHRARGRSAPFRFSARALNTIAALELCSHTQLHSTHAHTLKHTLTTHTHTHTTHTTHTRYTRYLHTRARASTLIHTRVHAHAHARLLRRGAWYRTVTLLRHRLFVCEWVGGGGGPWDGRVSACTWSNTTRRIPCVGYTRVCACRRGSTARPRRAKPLRRSRARTPRARR